MTNFQDKAIARELKKYTEFRTATGMRYGDLKAKLEDMEKALENHKKAREGYFMGPVTQVMVKDYAYLLRVALEHLALGAGIVHDEEGGEKVTLKEGS